MRIFVYSCHSHNKICIIRIIIGGRRLQPMVLVIKRKGESKDSMFRKFTRSFIDEEIVDTLRKKQFYKKPSLKRKEEEKERRKNRFSKHKKVFKKVYRRI